MRKYRSQRIQKTLMALSGAALASTMMFTTAQNISSSLTSPDYYQTKISSQINKAVKAKKEDKHITKKNKIKKRLEETL